MCCLLLAQSTFLTVLEGFKERRQTKSTYNDTVLAYVDIGADLGCIDNTVFFYKDMITNVEREESNPGKGEGIICSGSAAQMDPQ